LKKRSTNKKKGFGLNPAHKGLFTKWCKSHGFGGVTDACIAAGKNSKDTHVVRMATFADNAKHKFKHKGKKKGS